MFVCIPKRGYVGVGTVSGEATPFDQATVEVDGHVRRLSKLELQGTYHHSNEAEDNEEYVVPVRWTAARPREQAVWETGMFANQNSACKLRNRFTLDELPATSTLRNEPLSAPTSTRRQRHRCVTSRRIVPAVPRNRLRRVEAQPSH